MIRFLVGARVQMLPHTVSWSLLIPWGRSASGEDKRSPCSVAGRKGAVCAALQSMRLRAGRL